jgi:hypothetical protein
MVNSTEKNDNRHQLKEIAADGQLNRSKLIADSRGML